MSEITGYRLAKRETTKRLIAEMQAAKKRNKFGAVKVKLDGYTFDSKAEAKRYSELKLLEKAGEISHIVCVHPEYDLMVNRQLIAKYKADFLYYDKNSVAHVEDVKSPPTAAKRDFILIRKLMKAIHGIDVEIVGSPALRSAIVGKAA